MRNVISMKGGPFQADANQPLPPSGGGGTYDGMEQRVVLLEEGIKELRDDVKAMRTDVSYIRGRMEAMPSTIQLLGFVVAIFVAAGLMKHFFP